MREIPMHPDITPEEMFAVFAHIEAMYPPRKGVETPMEEMLQRVAEGTAPGEWVECWLGYEPKLGMIVYLPTWGPDYEGGGRTLHRVTRIKTEGVIASVQFGAKPPRNADKCGLA